MNSLLTRLVANLFAFRRMVVVFAIIITLVMFWFAIHLKVDAGFRKNVPQEHEYMKTYFQYEQQFGGGNRILIALEDSSGDIFNAEYMAALETVTKKVASVPGVDGSQVSSIFTPNTRFVEVTEEGFEGGPVVPADFKPTPEGLERVRENALKAGIVGRLIANDFSAAMISANLLEHDPQTNLKLDYIKLASDLENQIRKPYKNSKIKVHIIGFAKMIGDVSDGAKGVLVFFAVAVIITAFLLFVFTRSRQLTIWPIVCSLVAVIWQLGLLTIFGKGIDPMSILVPFLIFAIGVSHAVQMVNGVAQEMIAGATAAEAAQRACCRLLVPGIAGLLAELLGFLTLLLIEIDIIRELAVAAAIGVGVVVVTNMILLPVLLSYVKIGPKFAASYARSQAVQCRFWDRVAQFAKPRWAMATIAVALVLAVIGYLGAEKMKIGDLEAGAPALRQGSRYNKDTRFITQHFSIGVDLMSVLVESKQQACTDYSRISHIDDFAWYMENVPGVQSVIALPSISKQINAATYEGNLNWRVLSRNQDVLAQATGRVPTTSGLLNSECTVMPVMIFTEDHKSETIDRVVAEVKSYVSAHPHPDLTYRLATGAVGVMAATNEAVASAKWPMLLGVYAAVTLLCLISFRSVRGTIAVVLPLVLVSYLAEALMAALGIGLTVATLPVVALGVGVGVDYGIYIFSRMSGYIRAGMDVEEAYRKTLELTGNAVFFTGFTLAIGVSTWLFSALKFQSDMGVLLTFMFIVNMIAAVVLLPAIAAFLFRKRAVA